MKSIAGSVQVRLESGDRKGMQRRAFAKEMGVAFG
jgi:hypothetical protein